MNFILIIIIIIIVVVVIMMIYNVLYFSETVLFVLFVPIMGINKTHQ